MKRIERVTEYEKLVATGVREIKKLRKEGLEFHHIFAAIQRIKEEERNFEPKVYKEED